MIDPDPTGQGLDDLLDMKHRNPRQSTLRQEALPFIRQIKSMQVRDDAVIAPPSQIGTIENGDFRPRGLNELHTATERHQRQFWPAIAQPQEIPGESPDIG